MANIQKNVGTPREICTNLSGDQALCFMSSHMTWAATGSACAAHDTVLKELLLQRATGLGGAGAHCGQRAAADGGGGLLARLPGLPAFIGGCWSPDILAQGRRRLALLAFFSCPADRSAWKHDLVKHDRLALHMQRLRTAAEEDKECCICEGQIVALLMVGKKPGFESCWKESFWCRKCYAKNAGSW